MDEMERLLIERKLERMIVDYWDEVDERWGEKCHLMYTEDGRFQKMGSQAEIKAFYDWRRGRGDRASLHLAMNMKVTVESKDKAQLRYVMMLYGADGKPPLDVKSANTIQTCVVDFVRVGEEWKIKSNLMKVIFKGDEPTTVMPDSILSGMRK